MLNFVQATASVAPQLCQPSSGIIMTNDISETNPEDATACIALSKNDSYVMSASGGKVSLFNMMTFKVMNDSVFSYLTFSLLNRIASTKFVTHLCFTHV